MIKKFLLIYILIFLTACSSNNDTVKNTTSENQNLVCFLKMQV